MIGELGALGCAPLWAISSILIKSQSDKLNALQINAIRGLFAAAFAVAIFFPTGRIGLLASLSLSSIIYLLVAVIIGFVAGDTLFIKGMAIIGVSKALPMSIIYPIFVLPFSIFIVGEHLSLANIAGIFIAVAGLYLITNPRNGSEGALVATRRQHWLGVSYVLAATLLWAIGTVILGFAMADLDPILAGAIRMPFMAMILFALVYMKANSANTWSHGFRTLIIVGLAGVLGIGLGGLLFMIGVKYAGAAKTAILSSTAPLFGVPLSMLMLRERITLRIVAGTVLCVAGIWFVI